MGAVLVASLLWVPGCRSGQPVIGSDANKTTRGTIGGVLQEPGGRAALAGRRVEAIDLASSARYSAVTNVNGGFSIQVPPGKYRLRVALREGEGVTKDPGIIDIGSSDLDANIMIEVGSASTGQH
jgi:hypothetical protein